MLGIALVAFFYLVEWLDRKQPLLGHGQPDLAASRPGPSTSPAALPEPEADRLPPRLRGGRSGQEPLPLPSPGNYAY